MTVLLVGQEHRLVEGDQTRTGDIQMQMLLRPLATA
jgi:hypothetical protein